MKNRIAAALALSLLFPGVGAFAAASPASPGSSVGIVDQSGTPLSYGAAVPTVLSSDYPTGATALTAGSGDVAAATATATLAGTTGKTTYLGGFFIVGGAATAAVTIDCTITGIISGTITFPYVVLAGVTNYQYPFAQSFRPAIPASSTNVSIAISCPSFGTGNTHAAIVAWGYQL